MVCMVTDKLGRTRIINRRRKMQTCDYCGRLIETTKWAHDGDEENLCETCLKWMIAHGEVLFELEQS